MHCVGGQRSKRGTASFRSGVGFLRLSHPRLVCILFSAPSLLQMKFSQEFFTPSSHWVKWHFACLANGPGPVAAIGL